MAHELTVEEIISRIVATECGGQCEVTLDPHVTNIKNLERLLPICLEQFGTTVALSDHPDGAHMILTIKVMSTNPHPLSHN